MYPSAVDATEPLKPVVLKCRAKGTPTPKINWYKDGLLIKGSPEESGFQVTLEGSLVLVGKRFHITREGSLIIFDPRMEDEGKYTCAAENKLGKISYDVSLYVETSECLFSFAIRSPPAREFRSILFEYIQSSSFRTYFQLPEIFILDIFHPLQSRNRASPSTHDLQLFRPQFCIFEFKAAFFRLGKTLSSNISGYLGARNKVEIHISLFTPLPP